MNVSSFVVVCAIVHACMLHVRLYMLACCMCDCTCLHVVCAIVHACMLYVRLYMLACCMCDCTCLHVVCAIVHACMLLHVRLYMLVFSNKRFPMLLQNIPRMLFDWYSTLFIFWIPKWESHISRFYRSTTVPSEVHFCCVTASSVVRNKHLICIRFSIARWNVRRYICEVKIFQLDLMAQRLACRAEDREVPGSSPTQDLLLNHVHVTSLNQLGSKAASGIDLQKVEYMRGIKY